MPKFVKAVKGFSWEDMGRTALGFGIVGVGSAVGQEIGSLISGYLAQRFVCKSTFSKQLVMAVSILSTIDMLMERLMGGRGVM